MCSFEDRRAERIPPSAPVSSRNGGISTRRAGKAMKRSMRDSTTVPARMSTTPATKRTGSDSRTIRRARGRSVRKPRINMSRQNPPVTMAMVNVT